MADRYLTLIMCQWRIVDVVSLSRSTFQNPGIVILYHIIIIFIFSYVGLLNPPEAKKLKVKNDTGGYESMAVRVSNDKDNATELKRWMQTESH